MPLTRSFEGFTPPRRYDGQAFTQALVRESATPAGTYATIDTITLFPLDADPTSPQSRNFTTSNATLPDGWYIIRWSDALGGTFDSDPIQYSTSTGSLPPGYYYGSPNDLTVNGDPEELLTEASDWIDAQLGAREVDPITGRKVIEDEVEPWQWAKLVRATHKVAQRIDAEPNILQSPQWDTIKGPDFETSGRTGSLFGNEVSDLLIDTYLIVRSGRAR
jgi:hypothetical protein